MEIKGSKMLKGFGIVEIVFGGITLIIGLLAVLGALVVGNEVSNMTGSSDVGDKVAGLVIVAAIIVLVTGVLQLVAGIMGAKNSKNPQGAKKCFFFGIALLAMVVISIILNIKAETFSVMNIIGFIIPGFYTYSAYLVKSNG